MDGEKNEICKVPNPLCPAPAALEGLRDTLIEISKIASKNSYKIDTMSSEHQTMHERIKKLYSVLIEGNGRPAVTERIVELESEIEHINDWLAEHVSEAKRQRQAGFSRRSMWINTILTCVGTFLLVQVLPILIRAFAIVQGLSAPAAP